MPGITLAKRQYFDERLYLRYAYTFGTLDFTEWNQHPQRIESKPFWPDLPEQIASAIQNLEKAKHNWYMSREGVGKLRFNPKAGVYKPEYNDILPAYCSGFKSYLGYRLSHCKPVEVSSILDYKFPRPDETACDYLTDILAEIELETSQGFGYDPGQYDGIDICLPAEPAIQANIKTATRWIEKARAQIVEVRTYTPRAPRKDTVEQMASTQNPTRPNTILGRTEAAEKLYRETLQYFKNKGKGKGIDFTEWQMDVTAPDGEQKTLYSDQLIPPYSRKFPTALGYVLTYTEVKYAAEVMDFHFPSPDKLDIDYLTDVLAEIEGILATGYLFSPKEQDGIDYYCGFKNEHEIFNASMQGVDTSNDRHREASLPVIERAKKWLDRAEAMISAKPTPIDTDAKPSPSSPTPPFTTLPQTELPGLKWEKSVADIGELFYRLAKSGFIDLREYREPNTGNLSALCRHICRLFQIPPEKSKDPAAALKAVMNTLLRGDTMEPGPVDEQLLWKKPLDRRPGNTASARVAAAIPKENGVGES